MHCLSYSQFVVLGIGFVHRRHVFHETYKVGSKKILNISANQKQHIAIAHAAMFSRNEVF